MAAGHQTRSYVSKSVDIPASQTAAEVCKHAIENEMRLNHKVDILLGKVAVTGTPTVALQDSNGHGIWNTIKTSGTLSASTDKTVTVDASTGVFTAASHGYTKDQLVTINSSGTVPGGLLPGNRYFIEAVTTNTFKLATGITAVPNASYPDAGSGTITVTAATVVTLALNVEVAGDQAVMPLRPNGRVIGNTGAGDTIQVIDVRLGYTY